MPSIRKVSSKKGTRYQARVRITGYPEQVKTFNTLKEARSWNVITETNIHKVGSVILSSPSNILFRDMSERYIEEVLPAQKGFKQENNRLKMIVLHLGSYSLINLTPLVLSTYRDERIKSVSGSTVKKELSLISRIINVGIKEWGYHLPNGNPVKMIRYPKSNKSRDRRLEGGELNQLLMFSNSFMTSVIILLIETGMRRGELCKIRINNIDRATQTLILLDTKNGSDRTVPLTSSAILALKNLAMESNNNNNNNNSLPSTFLISYHPDHISHQFNKICISAGIKDLRLHDLRHEATTRFFEKGLNTMEVASITGHKTVAMLQRYTHLRVENLLHRIQ